MQKRMKGFFGKSGWTLTALLLTVSGTAAGAQERPARHDGDVKTSPKKNNAAKNAEKGRNAADGKEKVRFEKKKREWATGSR